MTPCTVGGPNCARASSTPPRNDCTRCGRRGCAKCVGVVVGRKDGGKRGRLRLCTDCAMQDDVFLAGVDRIIDKVLGGQLPALKSMQDAARKAGLL